MVDAMQTKYTLDIGRKEGNPIASVFPSINSYLLGKIIVALIIAIFLIHYNKTAMLIILSVVMGLVAAWNILALYSWI